MRHPSFLALAGIGLIGLGGCGGRPQPVNMAPPVGGMTAPPQSAGVFDWTQVPQGQQVPVNYARFDQGGYQIYASSGETIVVPFANQNLYVMKFGRSPNGQMFFVNEGDAPTLYLPPGGYLENAAAQNARWYPIPDDYNYTRPMYVSLAPSWSDYVGMGWYPGMHYYGGLWGYTPHAVFSWMPGFYVNIGGTRYRDYVSYRTYYNRTPGYVRNRVIYNYSAPRSTGSFGVTRAVNSTGSFGTRRSSSGFGSSSGGGGSFGTRRSGSTGSFGGGSFGTRRSGGSGSFGSGSSSGFGGSSGSSFGSGRSSGGGSFGGNSGGSVSFGTRSSGGSFGGTRSTGGSFGGGRSSGGSSSFGRSSGGSFGGSSGRRSSGSFGGGRRR